MCIFKAWRCWGMLFGLGFLGIAVEVVCWPLVAICAIMICGPFSPAMVALSHCSWKEKEKEKASRRVKVA